MLSMSFHSKAKGTTLMISIRNTTRITVMNMIIYMGMNTLILMVIYMVIVMVTTTHTGMVIAMINLRVTILPMVTDTPMDTDMVTPTLMMTMIMTIVTALAISGGRSRGRMNPSLTITNPPLRILTYHSPLSLAPPHSPLPTMSTTMSSITDTTARNRLPCTLSSTTHIKSL